MKKSLLFFLSLFLTAALTLTGCAGKSELTAYDLYSLISDKLEIPECEVFSYVSDTSHDRLLTRLYGESDDAEPPAALSLCDDYLICLFKGNTVWELHIFRTVSIYENDKLTDMLLMRRDRLQKNDVTDYLSEEDAERVRGAQVMSHRNFVLLAVTDDNETVHKVLSACS